MTGKVIARIFGGLGNQLFCYAAARRLALMNEVELVIDDRSGFARDDQYRRGCQLDHFSIPCRRAVGGELLEPFSRLRRYIKRNLNRRRSFASRTYIAQQGMDFDARLLGFRVRGTVYVEGYWQGEGYFKDVADSIRSDLQIRPPIDAPNRQMAARIRGQDSVAVHLRFFDAPGGAPGNNAPDDYYHRAIAAMDVLQPKAHYFVFSDRPDVACERIDLPRGRTTLVGHNSGDSNAYADLWLMTQCRHFIIANSTFSWWGAWLAAHPSKRVIAPGFEMRHGKMWWGFDGLLPEEWIKL